MNEDFAFPFTSPTGYTQHLGLTKREYFAAMAMQGLCAGNLPIPMLAKLAVQQADALIAELAKTKEG